MSIQKKPIRGRSAASRKRKLLRKSRYYQKSCQKLYLAAGVGIFVFVFILILAGIKGCGNYRHAKKAASDNVISMKATQDLASDSADTKEAENTVTMSAPVTLTLSVVGDCTLGTDETFDYSTSLNAYYENNGAAYFLQNVKSIFAADDLTIANFEGTLTESDAREDKTFAFKGPAEFTSILTSGSVEAVTTANNHSHDYGDQGYEDTIAALDAAGIVNFGYDKTAVMDVKGVKVGLVGIYELKDHLEREQQLKDNIAKVKAEGAQLIVVIFHWGNEKETCPDSNQTTLGRLAIDEGADLVCGHHPHVLQGIEEYKGKNIVYSLGNFCFGGNQYPSDMDSMIFQQTFSLDQNGLKADNVTNIIPCSISSDSDYNNYQPTPAEGEEADRILQKIQERSSWISEGISSSDDQGSENENYDEDTTYYDDSEEDYSDSEDGYEEDFMDSQETDDSEEEW